MLYPNSAAILREQIASSLSARIPAALSPRVRTEPERTACEIAGLDLLLQGGLPVGALTEFVGADCSGRMSAALAYGAAITRTGSVCAWIDTTDSLDPESAAANGVDLERLLWVRCGPQLRKPPQTVISNQVGASFSKPSETPRHTGGGSPHPRSEGRDMPQAIAAMLHAHGGLYDRQVRREKRVVGTPGAPNRPLSNRSGQREEQVNSDRLPPRRGDNLAIVPRCSEPQPRRVASVPSGKLMPVNTNPRIKAVPPKPLQALDQALRATDLLLQGGGFSAIVLDLGSIPPEIAWRIPLATWFRFRAACERTRVSLLLFTQHPCARSSAALVVRLEPGMMEVDNRVMTGIRYHATTERNRSRADIERVVPIRKPPQSERPGQWKSEAAWARMK
jgi:recombination protein RecA